MTSKRVYFVMSGLIILLLIGLLAGTYGANKLFTAQATTLTSLKAKSQALAQEQRSLIRAKKDIEEYAGLAQIAQTVVPQDKNQAEAVREIVNLATKNNVVLGSITFPTSTLGGEGTASGAPASAGPRITGTSSQLSQLTPATGIPGVYQLTITVTSDTNSPAKYDQIIGFLSALEHNRRTALINSVVLQPSSQDPSLLGFTIILNEYIKP